MDADVVTPDDDDVGFLLLPVGGGTDERQPEGEREDVSYLLHVCIYLFLSIGLGVLTSDKAQRNPMWLMPVSGGVPRRAAGR